MFLDHSILQPSLSCAQDRGLASTSQPSARLPPVEQRLAYSAAERPRVSCKAAVRVTATSTEEASTAPEVAEDEDLQQIKDRQMWYVARFIADDAPDFNPAEYVDTAAASPTQRLISIDAEVSREKVPLRNAYMHVGQRCSVRVNSGPIRELTVCSPPFPLSVNQDPLFKARGDISAGEIKIYKEIVSVQGRIDVLVSEKEAEEVFHATEGDKIEVGPFVGAGIDIRPMQSIWQFPTIVIFAEGRGIATAKALIESASDTSSLNMKFRQDVRLYYRAPNEASLLFQDKYASWEADHNTKVFTGTRETFLDLFDDDETLVYEPETTAAIILTGGDEESEKAALEVCKEAEITVICKDSEEMEPTKHLSQITGGQV